MRLTDVRLRGGSIRWSRSAIGGLSGPFLSAARDRTSFGRPHHLGIVFDGGRSADEKSLHCIALFIDEKCCLSLGFDTLGDDRQIERASQANDGANNRGGLRIFLNARNKRLIRTKGQTQGERPPNTCLVACDMTNFGLVLLGWRSPNL